MYYLELTKFDASNTSYYVEAGNGSHGKRVEKKPIVFLN